MLFMAPVRKTKRYTQCRWYAQLLLHLCSHCCEVSDSWPCRWGTEYVSPSTLAKNAALSNSCRWP